MNEFSKRMKEMASIVESDLKACFDKPFSAPDIIISAMKYSLFAGGKRLRPILMKEACRCLGGDVEQVTPLACAIEMIHTYSLIHDDLPAMDDDDLRRGEPTNHKVYGENMAILAGDALLNYAMETAIDGILMDDTSTKNYYKAMQLLFKAAGVDGMIGGQTGDILCESDEHITEEKLIYVHEHKTGALIKAAVLCGGLVGGANAVQLDALKVYGESIGLAFQIVDDILDIVGTESELGKPIGSDEKNHKSTFVSLYGLASSQERVKELDAQACSVLAPLGGDTEFLENLAHFICQRVN